MTLNYETLSEKLTGRNRDSRKLGNNTYLIRKANGDIAVRLHNTDVVTYHPNHDITFDSGGYRTMTTKARINEFAPVILSQKNGHWSITHRINFGHANHDWKTLPWVNFADGIRWDHAAEKFVGEGPDEKSTVKTARKLKAFVNDYMTAFDAGKVPAPGPGDCWGCLMRDKATGKSVMGSDHIKEKYYVPSLLNAAMQRFPASKAAQWYVAEKWQPDFKSPWTVAPEFIRSQVAKSLYRFVKEESGISA